jgi:hypothetical protein
MNVIERGVLEVCREVVLRQGEMLPLLATALQVPEDQVFHTWAFRRCQQRGRLEGSEWGYFFHGLECDLTNGLDGRFLRIDFGPRGRVDTFTAWGILQFLMTSVAPWMEFPQLKAYFATGAPPFDPFSGSFEKLAPVWDRLMAQGAFERAEPSLIALEAKYTDYDSDGLQYVRFPPEISEQTQVDCLVAARLRLSAWGLRLLELQEIDCLNRVRSEG